jgi:hypothetical protein
MKTREELKQEFISLRNAQVKRPPSSNKRLWNLYMDHLNESEALAEMKSNEGLESAIKRLKEGK